MKHLAIFLMLSFAAATTFAQDSSDETFENSNSNLKHSIGASAGQAHGNGLSYRFWPGKLGVQATFGPLVDEDEATISTGLTFLYSIARTEHVELFAYQGNHFHYQEETFQSWDPEQGQSVEGTSIERNYYTGIGIGVEFIILKRVNLDLMAGYTAAQNLEEFKITAGLGLFYNF